MLYVVLHVMLYVIVDFEYNSCWPFNITLARFVKLFCNTVFQVSKAFLFNDNKKYLKKHITEFLLFPT